MPPSDKENERRRKMNEMFGMGDPMQNSYYYEGYRDPGQGDPREKSIVTDPAKSNFNIPKQDKVFINTFFHELKNYLSENPVFTKRPAFVEAPYFAKPKVSHNTIVLPASSVPTLIWSYPVKDRNRVVVTTIGIDVDPPILVDDQELLFWFAISGKIIPFFDDQSTIAAALADFQAGKTTIIPGTTESPFDLRENGVPLEIRGQGERVVELWAQNYSTTLAAKLEPLITFYEYWMPKSTAFERGDNQV